MSSDFQNPSNNNHSSNMLFQSRQKRTSYNAGQNMNNNMYNLSNLSNNNIPIDSSINNNSNISNNNVPLSSISQNNNNFKNSYHNNIPANIRNSNMNSNNNMINNMNNQIRNNPFYNNAMKSNMYNMNNGNNVSININKISDKSNQNTNEMNNNKIQNNNMNMGMNNFNNNINNFNNNIDINNKNIIVSDSNMEFYKSGINENNQSKQNNNNFDINKIIDPHKFKTKKICQNINGKNNDSNGNKMIKERELKYGVHIVNEINSNANNDRNNHMSNNVNTNNNINNNAFNNDNNNINKNNNNIINSNSNPSLNLNSEAYNVINEKWADFVNYNMNDKNNYNKVTEEDERKMKKICETHIEKNSKNYDYKETETTSHLNSLLSDMDFFGEITKIKLEYEKKVQSNKFISLEDIRLILSKNIQEDYFICYLLKKALDSEGCTCEIEIDLAEKDEEKEIFTAIQFITNGMYKFKKYVLYFYDNAIKYTPEQFNQKLQKKLSNLLNIDAKDILMANPRKGPYKITAIIKKMNFNELNEKCVYNYLKNDPEFNGIIKVEKSILLNGCRLNRKMFDSKGDAKRWSQGGERGGKPYYPPEGWIGLGINVWNRYDNHNNDWLDCTGQPGEWSVAYHGMGGILSPGEKNNNNKNRQQFHDSEDKYHKGNKVGKGICMTPNPKIMEESCSTYTIFGRPHKIGIMCRVNPKKIRCPKENENYWFINGTDNEIRPYRILIKEIK